MINGILIFIKKIILCVALVASLWFMNVSASWAHRPHDVINQLELSPDYHRDQTVYIIVRGQFLKSEDAGKSWHRIFNGLDYTSDLTKADLSIYSKNSQILYLSTIGDGIYLSRNGGESWERKNSGLEDLNMVLLAVSSHSSKIVLAASQYGGLYLTSNEGDTWSSIFDNKKTKITAIALSPSDDNTILFGDEKSNIYLSLDRGASWKKINTINDGGSIQSIAISPDFNEDKTILIGTEKQGIFKTVNFGKSFISANQGLSDKNIRNIITTSTENRKTNYFASTWERGVFQSRDGGTTWKEMSKGLTKDSQADEEKFSAPDFQDLRISSDFDRDKTMFLGGFDGLFKSTDGGNNWNQLETLSIRVITSLAISPNYKNDSTLAVGTYEREAYLSQDRGLNWNLIIRGFDIPVYRKNSNPSIEIQYSRFYSLLFSPNYEKDNTLFTTFLYKLFKSTNQGQFWDKISLPETSNDSLRDIYMAISPDFVNDGELYLVTKSGGSVFQTTDRGKSFSIIHKLKHSTNGIVISPNFSDDRTIFIPALDKLYKTIDAGKTWQVISNKTDLNGSIWRHLAISPNYRVDRTLFAGTNQGIFKTVNGGLHWDKLDSTPALKEALTEAIAISPNFQIDKTVIASVRGKGLYRTVDGGESFTQVGKEFSKKHSFSPMVMSGSSPLQFSPSYETDQTIYGFGSTTAQVYRSTDRGLNWEVINVPPKSDLIATAITKLRLARIIFNIYPILKLLLASAIALVIYIILGFLRLNKKIPFSLFQIQFTTSVATFLIVLFVLLFLR